MRHPDEWIARETTSLIAAQELLLGYAEEEAEARAAAGGGEESILRRPQYLRSVKSVREALANGSVLDVIESFRSPDAEPHAEDLTGRPEVEARMKAAA